MATATMSQDGTYRIDLRITRRVSAGDLASYLAAALRHVDMDRLPSILDGLSAKQVRDTIRDEMDRRGTDYIDGWADQFGYAETNERIALATNHVRRAYPELAKAEDSQRPALETLVTKMCRHGNTPRENVTGDPIKACDEGSRAHGHVEYGAFNPEGCFYSGDSCAVDAANAAAQETETEDDITWGRICTEHEGEPADTCQECNGEQGDDTDEEPSDTCSVCGREDCENEVCGTNRCQG
jgi:hypothetical protein